MAATKGRRSQPCDRAEALNRLTQAESFVEVAELVAAAEGDSVATPNVAAALAVLAGVAASDAACCARLKERPRGQDHRDAVTLLEGVHPRGGQMAKDLQRLLARKDDAQHGVLMGSRRDTGRMVEWAKRITGLARTVLEAT
ncbi:MAG: hypothetical protein H0U26_04590 [Acidimicrobiia bacterium]|nr:hypothetical protein [Acidimicrobiia bacterium]